MTAVYPTGTKIFTAKRDLTDDVMADHVNDLQNEVAAIENTLGAYPNQTGYLPAGDPTAKQWSSVRARLDYMMAGKHIPSVSLYNSAGKTWTTDADKEMTFARPASTYYDTHALYTSPGRITVKRSGFYHFNARVMFAASTLRGNRRLLIQCSSGHMAFASQMMLDNISQPDNIWLHTAWQGYLAAGAWVSLMTNLVTGAYANGKYTVKYAGLDGHMVRDY